MNAEIRFIENNKITIHNKHNLVYHVITIGEQTDEMASAHYEIVSELLSKSDKKIQFLVDLNRCGKNSPKARDTWRFLSNMEQTDKVAIFGLHPVAKVLASFVMGKLISMNKYRFFSTEEDAKNWLNNKKN